MWYGERFRARVRGIQNVCCFPFCTEESFRHFMGPERIVPTFYRSGTNRSDILWVRNESFRHFIGPERIVPTLHGSGTNRSEILSVRNESFRLLPTH